MSSSSQDIIRITVETGEGSGNALGGKERYHALFHGLIIKPKCREVSVKGPTRNDKQEAIKDSEMMGRAFQLEGECGVKRVATRLERKKWSQQELASASEAAIAGLLAPVSSTVTVVETKKLIPPGEGWTRFSDDMLWDPRSEVYFAQTGDQAGKYLMKDQKTKEWQVVTTPHAGVDKPIVVRAGGSSNVRKGAKLERTVILNEMPKIARLALKFPLSFLDSPASAFGFFQGLRNSEAADYCAKNFHTKLIPLLANKIHNWETKELEALLGRVLRELDAEILKSPYAFSGCNAIGALLLGDRIVFSGVGQIRVVLLFDDGSARELLGGTCDFKSNGPEKDRVDEARGFVHESLLFRPGGCDAALDDAQRILRATSPFEVLQIELGGPSDEKQVRTAYRKLALRVHPDKRSEGEDIDAFNQAFARLDSAKEALEAMLGADSESCRELHRVMRAEVHTREGAAELLQVEKDPTTDTEQVAAEAERACKKQIAKLAKMEVASNADYKRAVAICNEAVETLRRPSSKEALPRAEALLRIGLSSSRALGARDLRFPQPVVLMEPEAASWTIPHTKGCRIALLAGATSLLPEKQLTAVSLKMKRRPKASALQWCLASDPSAPSVGATCLRFEPKRATSEASGSAAKKQKTGTGSQAAGNQATVFIRHILFRHPQVRIADPAARREGSAKGPLEAENIALSTLEQLLSNPNAFVKLARELSDCTSAEQPGNLAGHLGWIGRGEQEQALEEAAFCLDKDEFSDVVTTSRGVHVLQRIG